jgi:hypothetical protein
MLLGLLLNVSRNMALQRKGMEIDTFKLITAWEMLLKTVGQPLLKG